MIMIRTNTTKISTNYLVMHSMNDIPQKGDQGF